MKTLLRTFIAVSVLAALGATVTSAETPMRIRFVAVVGDRPFVCGNTYDGLGLTRAAMTPEFLRLYVSGVRLIDANGNQVPLVLDQDGTWQQRDVAFLSFEGGVTSCASGSPQDHRFVSGTLPAGRYVAIRFDVGIPQSLDHADATIAASPLNLSDMFWSWQDGYKFFRIDGRVRGQSGRSVPFVFHLGSTHCSGSNDATHCASPNEAHVVLLQFDPAKPIVIDVAQLLARVNLERGNGCMMAAGDDCGAELSALGLDGSRQTVFRVK